MKQPMAFFAATIGVLAMTGLMTGCSDQTKEAASTTVQSADQDAANHVSAAGSAVKEAGAETGQAVKQTGAAVKEGAKEAVQPVKDAAHATGVAVKEGATEAGQAVVNTGAAIKEGTKEAVQPVKDAANATGQAIKEGTQEAGHAVKGAGAAATMTPAIKTAIGAAGIDTAGINVDTVAAEKLVTINGTVKSAGDKEKAAQAAMSAITKSGDHYKVKNNLTVTP